MIEPVSTASFVIVANTVVPNSRIRRTSGSLTALTLSGATEGAGLAEAAARLPLPGIPGGSDALPGLRPSALGQRRWNRDRTTCHDGARAGAAGRGRRRVDPRLDAR
ncbi:hypothetical protein Misp03_05800 [Microbispora sp. NBRC 16548]|nr:hypothetical protein Misp03_05800 [Microbispora sp. NBRC 16548]